MRRNSSYHQNAFNGTRGVELKEGKTDMGRRVTLGHCRGLKKVKPSIEPTDEINSLAAVESVVAEKKGQVAHRAGVFKTYYYVGQERGVGVERKPRLASGKARTLTSGIRGCLSPGVGHFPNRASTGREPAEGRRAGGGGRTEDSRDSRRESSTSRPA